VVRIFILWKALAGAKNDVNLKYFMPTKSKSYYYRGLDRPRGFQEVEASTFRQSAHKDNKVDISTAAFTLKKIFLVLRG
jgi:hypothetical protein